MCIFGHYSTATDGSQALTLSRFTGKDPHSETRCERSCTCYGEGAAGTANGGHQYENLPV